MTPSLSYRLSAVATAAVAVVVAEDNPTTDYLREAIEALADIKVANKRRVVSAAEDLAVQVMKARRSASQSNVCRAVVQRAAP